MGRFKLRNNRHVHEQILVQFWARMSLNHKNRYINVVPCWSYPHLQFFFRESILRFKTSHEFKCCKKYKLFKEDQLKTTI